MMPDEAEKGLVPISGIKTFAAHSHLTVSCILNFEIRDGFGLECRIFRETFLIVLMFEVMFLQTKKPGFPF